MRHALTLLLWLLPAVAYAQFGISAGLDGGVSRANTNIAFVESGPAEQDPTSVGLGIDVGGYWRFAETLAAGLVFEGGFFQAGPAPSPAIDFLIGPRLIMRSGLFHAQVSGGVVVSAFDDDCNSEMLRDPEQCDETVPTEAAGPGWGATISPLVSVPIDDAISILVGPTVRYRTADTGYVDSSETMTLTSWQFVLGVHLLLFME